MRTLEHRGQKIICQYIDDNFGRILAKKNIKYSILPVFSDNSVSYTHLHYKKSNYYIIPLLYIAALTVNHYQNPLIPFLANPF